MRIFALGSNGSGQLGLGHEEDVSAPSLVEFSPNELYSVKAGGNHTLLVCTQPDMNGYGVASTGQTGLSDLGSRAVFDLVTLATNSTSGVSTTCDMVAATWEASIFVCNHGAEVHACGSGARGELGLGQNVSKTETPVSIPNFPPPGTRVAHISACMGHVAAVLDNGELWGWGNNTQGQLGESAPSVIWQPTKIEDVSIYPVQAACGKDFTCVVSHASSGQFQIIGLKKRDRWRLKADAPAALPAWQDVQASWGGVYVLTDQGEVIAWGRDDHGQLPPPSLPEIQQIAAGSEHVVALTKAGKVLTWGWGEHGNCGTPVDDRSDVKGRWNELHIPAPYESASAVGVGAGCATTWIATSTGT